MHRVARDIQIAYRYEIPLRKYVEGEKEAFVKILKRASITKGLSICLQIARA
jgi:hypothetical protein